MMKTFWKTLFQFFIGLFLFFLVVGSVWFAGGFLSVKEFFTSSACPSTCEYHIAENFPTEVDLEMFNGSIRTDLALIEMFDHAKERIYFVELDIGLTNNATQESLGIYGNNVFRSLVNAIERNIDVVLIQNKPSSIFPDTDSETLKKHGARILNIDPQKVLPDGILHTKLIICDDSFYLGSGNLDWKSLSQFKELGLYVKHCSCLSDDLLSIYNAFKYIADEEQHDPDFSFSSDDLQHYNKFGFYNVPLPNVKFNVHHPHIVPFLNNNQPSKVYISSSPKFLNINDRTWSLDAILGVINRAQHNLSLSIMEYIPITMYHTPRTYWNEIDTALKNAILRNISVNFIVSKWNHTYGGQFQVMKSLNEFGQFCNHSGQCGGPGQPPPEKWCFGKFNVRVFEIPDPIETMVYPFTRLNHCKFLFNEDEVLITTSNFASDYFYSSGGIDITIRQNDQFHKQIEQIFWRDWNSPYAHPLSDYL